MKRRMIFVVALLSIPMLFAACGGSQPGKPTIALKSLTDGSQFELGQVVAIGYEAADVKGIVQVELTINGEPIHVETVSPPVNVFSGSFSWRPQTSGSHLIQVLSFNVDGASSDLAQVAVIVVGEAAQADDQAELADGSGSTPAAEPTLAPTRVLGPPTPVPATPTAVAEDSAAAAANTDDPGPQVRTVVALNVRAGPGIGFPILGRLPVNATAEIVGRDQASNWWQIVFESDSSNRGWVAAGADFSEATNAGGVPVVGGSIPIGDNTEPEPAPENDVVFDAKPVISRFTADRSPIAAGETTVLRWDLSGAKAAYLRYNSTEEGVVAPGEKSVAPGQSTTYTLIARNDLGETTASVTVNVSGPTPTPVVILKEGRSVVMGGQTIDFDQGLVQADGAAGADFFWDISAVEFKPRGGAAGTLIEAPYNNISLVDCRGASYGAPVDAGDGSKPIVGCYVTNEGRYGKFAIVAWDLTGKVTIDWLTWAN